MTGCDIDLTDWLGFAEFDRFGTADEWFGWDFLEPDWTERVDGRARAYARSMVRPLDQKEGWNTLVRQKRTP